MNTNHTNSWQSLGFCQQDSNSVGQGQTILHTNTTLHTNMKTHCMTTYCVLPEVYEEPLETAACNRYNIYQNDLTSLLTGAYWLPTYSPRLEKDVSKCLDYWLHGLHWRFWRFIDTGNWRSVAKIQPDVGLPSSFMAELSLRRLEEGQGFLQKSLTTCSMINRCV